MPSDVKWIKITTDIFDDEKILLIESMPDAYAIITCWFKLLCLAGKQNNSGVFLMGRIAYTDKMLATIFRMKESTVTMALQVFEQFGMIELVDGVYTIPNWGKHQSLDAYEKKKAYDREYRMKERAKQKLLAGAQNDSQTTSRTTVVVPDKEEDIDKERDREGDKECRDVPDMNVGNTRSKRFVPPTVDDVSTYCHERGNCVNPQRFVDYYSSNGWMVGKNKMKDWKAAVRTWEQKDQGRPQQQTSRPRSSNPFLDLLAEEGGYE